MAMNKRTKITIDTNSDLQFLQENFEVLYHAYLIAYRNELASTVTEEPFNRSKLDNQLLVTLAETLGVRGAAQRFSILTKKDFAKRMSDAIAGQTF